MSISLHISRHAFSPSFHASMRKRFCLGARDLLIILLIEAISIRVPFRVAFATFGSLASLKSLSTVGLDILLIFFLNRFISSDANDFKSLRPNGGFLFEGFF